MWPKNSSHADVCAVIGVHLLVATGSFTWIYGNLSTYMNSFYHFQCYPQCLDGDSQWILNLYLVLVGVGLFLFKFTQGVVGLRWTFILTIVTHNTAYLLSAWAMQVSVVATCVLMGVLMGVASGMVMNIGFNYIHMLAFKHTETYLVTSVAGGCLLNVIQNQIITQFVNPSNLKPDAHRGHLVFFSQTEILHRVPKVIILLALINLSLQLLGFFLMSIPPPAKSVPSSASVAQRNGPHEEHSKREKDGGSLCSVGHDAIITLKHLEAPYAGKHHATHNGNNNYGSQSKVERNGSLRAEVDSSETSRIKRDVLDNSCNGALQRSSSETRNPNYTPLEAIATTKFWSLWLYGASSGLSCSMISSYYKEFGLLYIHNDKHLTLLGSIMPGLAGVCLVISGGLIKNNLIHVSDCLVLSLALNCLTCAFWFFAPRLGEAVYMVLILLLTLAQSWFYFVLTNGTLKDFGSEHFATIYSMTFSGRPIASFLSALYLSPLLKAVGWFWVFMTSSCVSLVALTFKVISSSILFK